MLTRLPSLVQGVHWVQQWVGALCPVPSLCLLSGSPFLYLELHSAPGFLYDPLASSSLSMLQPSLLPSPAGWAAAGVGLSSTPEPNLGNWGCGLFAELFQVVLMEKCMCA